MPQPIAVVSATVVRLEQIQQEVWEQKNVFGLVKIDSRIMGRTACITGPTVNVDFAWEVAIPPGQTELWIEIEIWQLRGTLPSLMLQSRKLNIPILEIPEKVFRAKDAQFAIVLRFACRLVPGGGPVPTSVPRQSASAEPVLAVVLPPRAYVVVIEEIRGLYKPTGADPPAKRAGYIHGYTSEDHQGRMYLNRNPNGDWVSGQQFIDVRARVHVPMGLNTLPPNPKIHWTVQDPDDPINDQPICPIDAGSYLDQNDYSNAGPVGAQGNDNEGVLRNPRWEAVGNSALVVLSLATATTTVDQFGYSSVRIHCPDLAGDNLIVRAELGGVAADQLFPAQTGVMTMWQRIDVEYVQLQDAHPLPVNAVPQYFEPACIQLDFTAPRLEPAQQYVGNSKDTYEPLPFADSKFQNNGVRGWFCLIAACWACPTQPAISSPDIPTERITVKGRIVKSDGGAESVFVRGLHSYAEAVILEWNDEQNQKQSVFFGSTERKLHPANKPLGTEILLLPHDITPDFTAGDGSHGHFTNLRRMFYPMGGYGAPADVSVTLCPPGRGQATAGVSPSVPRDNNKYWRGRTIIYTHHPANTMEAVLRTIVHELTHAFGLPHKCGLFAWSTQDLDSENPIGTCCMNYNEVWMIDNSGTLLPGTSKRVVPDHCARHVKELRRTRVQNNPGLGWQ